MTTSGIYNDGTYTAKNPTFSMHLPRFLLPLFLRKPAPELSQDNAAYFAMRYAQVPKFFARFGVPIDFAGKAVLDFGSGLGNTSIYARMKGAAIVDGIEPDDIWRNWATAKSADYPGRAVWGAVRFFKDASNPIKGGYDIIISEDCMEHYDDPVGIVKQWRTLLAPGGRVLIGFSPLWKSPTGGHLGYMSRLPWLHLLFKESDLMEARRRYRPDERTADGRWPATLSEMRGGLNKMTLARFHATLKEAGFEIESLRVNVSDSWGMKLANLFAWGPWRELFVKNVYCVAKAKGATP